MSMPGKIIVQLENSDRRRVECMHVKYEWLLPRNTVNAEAADSRLQNMWLEKAECIRSLALNDICFYSSTQIRVLVWYLCSLCGSFPRTETGES